MLIRIRRSTASIEDRRLKPRKGPVEKERCEKLI